jgi:hypothetical protein
VAAAEKTKKLTNRKGKCWGHSCKASSQLANCLLLGGSSPKTTPCKSHPRPSVSFPPRPPSSSSTLSTPISSSINPSVSHSSYPTFTTPERSSLRFLLLPSPSPWRIKAKVDMAITTPSRPFVHPLISCFFPLLATDCGMCSIMAAAQDTPMRRLNNRSFIQIPVELALAHLAISTPWIQPTDITAQVLDHHRHTA